MLFQRPSPDIKPCLYSLLYEFLHNNWRYFFKHSVMAIMQSSPGKNDELEHEDQFVQIMQVSGVEPRVLGSIPIALSLFHRLS